MKAQSAGGAVRSEIEYPFAVRFGNALLAYARLAPEYGQHGDGDICWWAGCGFWALWFP